ARSAGRGREAAAARSSSASAPLAFLSSRIPAGSTPRTRASGTSWSGSADSSATPRCRPACGAPEGDRARSVRGRRVDGEEEERLRAGAPHVVPGAGGDRDQGPGRRFVLTIADPHAGLALEHVENLVAGVLLFGARVGPGRDRHDGALAARRLLEHPEKLALVLGNRYHLHHTSSIPSRARTRETRAVS